MSCDIALEGKAVFRTSFISVPRVTADGFDTKVMGLRHFAIAICVCVCVCETQRGRLRTIAWTRANEKLKFDNGETEPNGMSKSDESADTRSERGLDGRGRRLNFIKRDSGV